MRGAFTISPGKHGVGTESVPGSAPGRALDSSPPHPTPQELTLHGEVTICPGINAPGLVGSTESLTGWRQFNFEILTHKK